ncbi:hypothetical protein RJ640_014714 [Escallonia rubra]|uniref:NAF domain-containing protein n=1 Tax=Escallonia rubra TaxID=112253 RepID=A0AA88RJC1_9ASTE|nr:hypothetical protein RJ640_014714 [Escallonia rubra]
MNGGGHESCTPWSITDSTGQILPNPKVDREGLVTKSAQFDLSLLFEENKREEMRFATASCVISKFEEVGKAMKFGHQPMRYPTSQELSFGEINLKAFDLEGRRMICLLGQSGGLDNCSMIRRQGEDTLLGQDIHFTFPNTDLSSNATISRLPSLPRARISSSDILLVLALIGTWLGLARQISQHGPQLAFGLLGRSPPPQQFLGSAVCHVHLDYPDNHESLFSSNANVR